MENPNTKIVIPKDRIDRRVRRFSQIHAWALLLLPLTGTLIASGLALQNGIGQTEILPFALMYFLTTAGITVGFHRLFSHGAFQTPAPIQVLLGILGSMACQGPLIYWVSNHRRHHQFSDRPGDPHSPYTDLESDLPPLKGFWHAHIGWIFRHELTNSFRFSKDLIRNPTLSRISRLYLLWVMLGLVLPALLGGILSGTWNGAFLGFLWGGLVRIFFSSHMSYSINSVCHFFGTRPFDTRENSTNNLWFAIPTIGESWHNNHHAFPSSAKFGLKFWQIDIGYAVVYFLKITGLAQNVKVPGLMAIEKRRKESV